jgi:hypothetical protein
MINCDWHLLLRERPTYACSTQVHDLKFQDRVVPESAPSLLNGGGLDLFEFCPDLSDKVQQSSANLNCQLLRTGQVTHRAIHVFGKWPINGLLGHLAAPKSICTRSRLTGQVKLNGLHRLVLLGPLDGKSQEFRLLKAHGAFADGSA